MSGRSSSCESLSKSDDKTSECFVDSGYIDSGALSVTRSGLMSERDMRPEESIDEDSEEPLGKEAEMVSTKLDSGIVVDLTESLGDLKLRNDLGSDAIEQTQVVVPELNISEAEPEPWQIYYQQDDDGDTQLHIAIVHGFYDAVLALLHMCPHPALLDIRNDAGRAPIHLAVLTSQSHIARRLLIAGAKVNTRDAEGNTALHLASNQGDLMCFKALTEPLGPQQTDVRTLPQALNQKNYDGETCIHLAAMGGHIDILRHLVWFGADINERENKGGRTALHLAIQCGNIEVLKFLTTECESISYNIRTYSGHTALQLGSAAIKAQLIETGAFRQEDDSESEYDSESDEEDDDNFSYYNDKYFNIGLRGGETINVA